ncbi:MAG: protein kinase domain-containing protein [Planctomycetota bacterium]
MSKTMDKNKEHSLIEVVDKKQLKLSSRRSLGKYRLQKRLGKGGYCEVWKARDTVEGIWVALKIPIPDVAGERDNETVLREVRLVAQLKHPHIMPVKNADVIEHHAVLATELSTGTLEDCYRPMGVRRIISIIRQVLDGLSYAHQKRIVHCDVTPGNIFLFPNGRAAIGDFYVAPEQAFGKPTYRSDCFSVALILYEFLTGVLPRWPFHWPPKGLERLRERTGIEFVRFMKKALNPDPEKRFTNAKQMLAAMEQALPKALHGKKSTAAKKKGPDWRQLRRQDFTQRYQKVLGTLFSCVDCGEPIAESMQACPWCGSERNCFDNRSQLSHICHHCHRGVAPDWHYCPWCYSPGFIPQEPESIRPDYKTKCDHCGGKMTNFMKYCPWCHRKQRKKWQISPFPEICTRCGWSVDSSYWNLCPWCSQRLI